LLLLVASTPAPELFRVARRLMPATLADILFLAYRSLFILLERALAAREAVRLRGSGSSWLQRLRRNSLVGGLSVLRATELASEQYAAIRLRGYPGSRAAAAVPWRSAPDSLLLAGGALALAAALIAAGPTDPAMLLVFVPLVVVPLYLGREWAWRHRT